MARNIFNQPPKEAEHTPPAPADAKPAKMSGSVGGLRDSLREITANSIRDIDPDRIEEDGLRDRLLLEDDSIDVLADSIRKHGQQVPIMVRPTGQPDRYRIVYGRRRLAAIRKIGGTIKAIVRTLDDEASLIAQGQENNLRLDPSFIEKSIFIKEMQQAGYKAAIIQDALGLTRQGVSNHRVVIEQLPDDLVRLIGPAHGIGRRQWSDLAAFTKALPVMEIATSTLSAMADNMSSADRFLAILKSCQIRARATAKGTRRGQTRIVKTNDGAPLGTLATDGKSVALRVMLKDQPEFGQWVEQHAEDTLRDLYAKWQDEHRTQS